MESFLITGGKKLVGSVRLGGAKNASFKLMIASLLAQGKSKLLNLPHINDVEITRKIITGLGGRITSAGERMLIINAATLKCYEVEEKFGRESRASSMFIAPLLAKFQQATVPLPGGDKIGARPLERHFRGLKALGAQVQQRGNLLQVRAKKLKGTRYRFEKNTHTGTETMILLAVLAEGKTVLENAALEPEIDDLINFLNQMGAGIKRKTGRVIEITGVKKLFPTIYRIMPDRNETITYACAALATQGDLVIENANPQHLESFLYKVREAGGGYELGNYGIRFFYQGKLKPTQVITQPHPGFMTDWQPLWAVTMTQAEGESIIHEAVHNNRFQYVPDLLKMGAKIKAYNPRVKNPSAFYNFNLDDDRPKYKHAVTIKGVTPLQGKNLKVPDLRAGATLVLAALIAQGQSRLLNIFHIDRGYENLDGRLIDLGAQIKRN